MDTTLVMLSREKLRALKLQEENEFLRASLYVTKRDLTDALRKIKPGDTPNI